MGQVRSFIHGRASVVRALLVLTLAMKLLVPVGFMPEIAGGSVRLILCDGIDHAATTVTAMPGMAHHHHHDHGHAKSDACCPFAGLTAPSLGGADPVQIVALIVAIMAAGLVLVATLPDRTIAHLRPPLRGPPIAI